jgi:hypothetical protein
VSGIPKTAVEDVVAKGEKKHKGIDPTWPGEDGEHPVTELSSDRQGALSPFGDITFPLDTVPYVHPETEINR